MDGKRNDSVWLARLAVIALLAAVMVISSDFTAAMASAGTDFLSLSGEDWWIQDDQAGTGVSRRVFMAKVPDAGWIPARVPGNIQADLENAHKLRPLWYGATDPKLYEVARKDWWYRKSFVVPAAFAGRRLTLVFGGVDGAVRSGLTDRESVGTPACFAALHSMSRRTPGPGK